MLVFQMRYQMRYV
ncbi:TPA: 23S rRNA methyltransferase attenuation leader peptide, partial [Enterococcus faecium]|nr:23S rRNA methyltransferase attenuation leader peptide [Enterococcus faecium]